MKSSNLRRLQKVAPRTSFASRLKRVLKTGKNRRGFRAREESVERLEDRTLLTKTLGIEVRLFTDSNGADAGGAPGTEIVDDRLNVGDHFFAEIFAGDLRDGSDVAAGIVGLGIDLTWNAAAFQSLNDPLDPAAVVTDRLPLVFSNVALDQNAGRILNLGGASLPPFVGAAVGVNQLESFALLHFRADAAVEDSPFRIAIGDDGSNLSLRDDAKGFNVDVEAQTITVIDPNTATLTVDVVADAVSEGAGAAATTATVTRSSDTSAALTVNLTSSDTSEATVPTTVMIPAGQASASFDIDAVDDTIIDGTQTVTITATAAAHDDGTDTLDVTDNDTQSLVVTPLAVNVNEGSTNTFSVRLNAQPTADVTVNVSRTAGDTDLSVSAGGTLTFTTSNWDTPQDVTLAAAEDADAVNGSATFTVSSAGLPSVDVTGTEVDNDEQSLLVTPVTLNVNEGGTNTFSVRLAAQPAADVTVSMARTAGDTDLSVSAGGTLTFTTSNWDTPQNVTLAAAEDADAVNGAATFTVSSAGLTSVDVTGTEVDNDTQSLVVTPVTLNVNEGATNTFSVRLAAQPTADVTVAVARTSGDTDLSVSAGATLTFTSPDWDTPQNVTLAAGEDADAVNGAATFTVSSTGLTSVEVTGNEVDNDTQSLVVTPLTLNVDEGNTNTFSVRLAAQPTADVTVNVARTAGDTDLSVSAGGTLTFTSTNWDTPQDVTLSTAEDADAVNGSATFTVSSAGLTSVDVTGNEVDNDTQSLVVTPVTLNVNEGATNTFSVRLAAQPTADVTVAVARTAGDTDLSVSAGGTLTFTTSNWDTPQNATLAAAEDADAVNGSATFTVSSAGLTSVDVTGNEVDNDTQSLVVTPVTLNVDEGATKTFSVRLASQPTADVTVAVARTAGDTDLSVSAGGTLTFTTSNWDTPQDVTLAAAEDADAVNGAATFTVSSTGLTSVDVTGTEVDNDTQSLVVTPVTLNVDEGATNTFSVRLAAQPTADVTVTVARTAGDTDLSVSAGGTLTFTIANWDTPQDVTLAAAEDADAVNGAATFTVSSTGLTSVDVTGTEVDNDTQSLTVEITADSVSEAAGAGATTGTVTRNTATTAALTVTLTSSDTSEATVPATVTIPAGQASATFDVDAIDDAIVDGIQTVTITASATAHADGTDSVDVADDDGALLTVVIAVDSVSESAGAGATTATVSRSSDVSGPLTVTLTSSDTSEATVPASITIPAGQTTSLPFDIDAIDDALPDGTQTVTITATAAAHADGSDTVDVTDDDVVSLIIDDGDAGYSQIGPWLPVVNYGYAADAKVLGQNRAGSATWTFVGLAPGQYRVSATWLNGNDRAINAPYSIRDGIGGPALSHVSVNQKVRPSGVEAGGRQFASLDVVSLTGDTLVVELTSTGVQGAIIADAVRIDTIEPVDDVPEILVSQGTATLRDGTLVDFGTAIAGDPLVTRSFQVSNTGTADLILEPIVISGAGFTLESPNFTSGQMVAPGGDVTFTVGMSTATVGNLTGAISFGHNDGSQNPFDLSLSGTVIAAPPAGLRIIDNGDPGFSQTGNWANVSNYGFDNDALAGNGINGAETAQWVFSGLSAGSFYEVSATWLRGGDRAASVSYVVRDGLAGPILGTIVVDQTKNPNGPPENSRPFQLLDTFSISGNTLVVELSTQGTTKAVIADAILVTDISPPAGPELTLTEGGNTLSDGGRVSFGPAAEGATRPTRTFTIQNTGGSDLILQPLTVTGAGFTLESANFAPNTVVPAGGTTSFTIGLSTATEGDFTGAVSFANNDSDESPFDLVLEGRVSAAPNPDRQIIDNGDAGFSTTGNWANVTGYGYDGDALAGNGINGVETARWVFSGLIAGDYQVSTTWLRGSDREANVPYVIRDGIGGPILAVTTINQKLEPVGNVFGGRRFQALGTLTITDTTLVVELSSAGSTKAVIADAVRIERTSPPEAPLSIPVGSMVPIRPLSSLDWLFSSPEEDEESLFDVF